MSGKRGHDVLSPSSNVRKEEAGLFFDKKGQGLSVNAIILIILGIVVLVVLILGFTIGWGRFLPFVQTNNVENIKVACDNACATRNTFDYCQTPREVKDGINENFKATCDSLSKDHPARNYGIVVCSPPIDCVSAPVAPSTP